MTEPNWSAEQKELLDKMAAEMSWAFLNVTFDEISHDNKSLIKDLKTYSIEDTLPLLAGLLTLPEYQSNCSRLEILICLALAHCKGRKKAHIGQASRWYRQLGTSKISLSEDDAEDVFVSLVHDDHGNYRIIEGTLENAGFYTQRIAEVVSGFPDASPWGGLKESFRALLRLSEAVCEKSQLERYSVGSDEKKPTLTPSEIPSKTDLVDRVVFAPAELSELGVSVDALQPFVFELADRENLLKEKIGSSAAEFKPVIRLRSGDFLLHLPTAVSLAVRSNILAFVNDHQVTGVFDIKLAEAYNHFLTSTPLLGGSPIPELRWEHRGQHFVHTFSIQADTGHYLTFHFFMLSTTYYIYGGLREIHVDDGRIARDLSSSIAYVRKEIGGQDGFKSGINIYVGCGWGKGYELELSITPDEFWSTESLPISDLVRLGQLNDLKPLFVFKVRDALAAAAQQGVQIGNINGFLNAVAWIRMNGGHVIPHEAFLDADLSEDTPTQMVIQQNSMLGLRAEADTTMDIHRVCDTNGVWHVVCRANAKAYVENDPINDVYASLTEFRNGRITIVTSKLIDVWLHLQAPNIKSRELIYRLSIVAQTWLPRVLDALPSFGALAEELKPLRIDLIFEDSDPKPIDDEPFIPEHDELKAKLSVSYERSAGRSVVRIAPGFMEGFRNPKNIAEQVIVSGLMQSLAHHTSKDPGNVDLQHLIMSVVHSEDARSFHAMRAQTFMHYVGHLLPSDLVKYSEIDYGIVKLGLGLVSNSSKSTQVFSGIDECTAFLNNVVANLLERIVAELSRFDKVSSLRKLYLNVEKARAEEDKWVRTSGAQLALHAGNEAATNAYISQSSELSGTNVASRTLIEIGLCCCIEKDGEELSGLELGRLLAMASLVSRMGGHSDAIQYQAAAPELKVSPFGDILFKDSFGQFVVEPLLADSMGSKFKKSQHKQREGYEEPTINPDVHGVFESEFLDAWVGEMGFTLNEGRKIVDALENYGILQDQAVFLLPRSEVISLLASEELDESSITAFLNVFTLKARPKWDKAPSGFAKKDLYPWRYGRRLSLVSRPILQLEEVDDPRLLLSPSSIRNSFGYIVSGTHSGTFDRSFYSTPAMKDKWRGKAASGHKHTQNVADVLSDDGWNVDVEVTLPKILNRKMDRDYGDVDVLAFRNNSSDVFVIECKDISFAANETMIAHQLSEYQGVIAKDGKPDKLKKHLDRVAKLNEHVEAVGSYLGISKPNIKSALVSSGLVPLQYAKIEPLKDSYVGPVDGFLEAFSDY